MSFWKRSSSLSGRAQLKKRQEIGRGLRLPVNQEGQRIFDEVVNKLYLVANESYEDFARALQEEYEENCGVTFGKVPIQAFAKIVAVVDEEEKPLGRDESKTIWSALVTRGFLAADGRLQPSFDPARPGFTLQLPEAYQQHEAAVIDVLASYQIERHIQRERDERRNVLRKECGCQPRLPGALEPHQASNNVPGRVRHGRAGEARRERCSRHAKD